MSTARAAACVLTVLGIACQAGTSLSSPIQVAMAAVPGTVPQTAVAGSVVPIPPSVRVVDAGGAGVPGISVTFAVSAGGGTLTGASTSTSAAGVATVGSWTLGTVAGANTVTATARGNTGIIVSSGAVNKAVSLTVAGRPSGASRTDVPENGQPFGVGVSINDVLLVGEPFSNRVGRFDLPSLTLGTTTVVGADPDDIAFSPDGKTAYVRNVGSATLSVIDVATNTQRRAIAMPGPAYRVAMSGDGAKLYVTTAVR